MPSSMGELTITGARPVSEDMRSRIEEMRPDEGVSEGEMMGAWHDIGLYPTHWERFMCRMTYILCWPVLGWAYADSLPHKIAIPKVR